MKMTKRLAAIALAVLMLLTMTACGDNSWAVQYGDTKVPTGVYTLGVMSEYANAYSNGLIEAYGLDGDIIVNGDNGEEITKTVSQYIADNSMETFKYYVAVKDLFEQKGLTISQEDYDEMIGQVNGYFENNAEAYEANGVSKDSFIELLVNNALRSADLYEAIYSGTDTVSDGDIKDYFNKNYVRFNYMLFNAYDVTTFQPLETTAPAYTSELAKLQTVANQQLSEEEFLKEAKSYNDDMVREGGTWDPIDYSIASYSQFYYDLYTLASGLEIGESGLKEIAVNDTTNGITSYVIVVAQRIEPEVTGKDYLDKADTIKENINTDEYYDMLLKHYDEMGVTENSNAFDTFAVGKLALDGFTSLIGE